MSQSSNVPFESRSLKASSHSSGMPFELQSRLNPEAMSHASGILFPLHSDSHSSGKPSESQSLLVPAFTSQASGTLFELQSLVESSHSSGILLASQSTLRGE